jgi:alkylhydroperoxidase family enzyme
VNRVSPLEPPYPADADAVLRAVTSPGRDPIKLFRVLVRNSAMADAMRHWALYELGPKLSLGLREREIVIDRTTARCGAEYEWGVHVAFFAGPAQLSAGQVTSLAHGSADDPCWTEPRERLLIRLVDSLHDTSDVDDALWADLAEQFKDVEVLDLVALCGWYHAISFMCRALRVDLEPGAARFADATNAGS